MSRSKKSHGAAGNADGADVSKANPAMVSQAGANRSQGAPASRRNRNTRDIKENTAPGKKNFGQAREGPNGGGGRRRKGPPPNTYRRPRVPSEVLELPLPQPGSRPSSVKYSASSLGSGFKDDGSNGGRQARPDIRNDIGLELLLLQTGDMWFEGEPKISPFNWDGVRPTNGDFVLRELDYQVALVEGWMEGVTSNVQVSLIADKHWECDIDTNTGTFLQPVEYPDSVPDTAKLDATNDYRRQVLTSEACKLSYCRTRALSRGRPVRPFRKQLSDNNGHGRPHGHNRQHEVPVAVHHVQIPKKAEPAMEAPEYHRFVPRLACFLRPAEKRDMESVRHIYNWEVEHGLQALDADPLQTPDFEQIWSTTQQLHLPFIVAERGSARDLGLTGGNISYSTLKQYPAEQQDSDGNDDKRGEILGFAYLSVRQRGIAGCATRGTGRATATAHVYVHPDHRRKRVGFSLLDKLMSTVSECFHSEGAYDFVDPADRSIYRTLRERRTLANANGAPAAGNPRHYRVYISFLVRHQLPAGLCGGRLGPAEQAQQARYDDDLVWVRAMLEDGLNFAEKVRFEAVHRSPAVGWLDEIVFEHSCLYDPLLVRDE